MQSFLLLNRLPSIPFQFDWILIAIDIKSQHRRSSSNVFFSLSSFHQLMIYKKRYANFSLRFYFHFETMYLMYSINIPWHIKATVCARAGFSLCLSGVLPQAQRRERVFQHLNYNYRWRVSCDWISSLSEWFFCSLYPSVFSIFRRNSLQIGIFDHVFLDV